MDGASQADMDDKKRPLSQKPRSVVQQIQLQIRVTIGLPQVGAASAANDRAWK